MNPKQFETWALCLAKTLALSPADCEQIGLMQQDLAAMKATPEEGEEVLAWLRRRGLDCYPSERISKLFQLFRDARQLLTPPTHYEPKPSPPMNPPPETESAFWANLMQRWARKEITMTKAAHELHMFRRRQGQAKPVEPVEPAWQEIPEPTEAVDEAEQPW